MSLIPTRPSPLATVLLLVALLSLTLSCHRETSQLGTEGAAVAHATPTPSDPNTPAAAKGNATDAPQTVASSSGPSDKNDRDKGQQSVSAEAKRASEIVAAAREDVVAPDASELIAQATEELNEARRAVTANYRTYDYVVRDRSSAVTQSNSVTANYRAAADTAQNVVDLLKSQAVPTAPAAKQKYSETLLAALSLRATALGLLAAQDHAEAGRAEIAYNEYFAAESDETKKARAEYELASLFYQLDEFQRAKSAYERLLARNAYDRRVLQALARTHERLAAAETASGDTAKAEADLASAKEYSARLRVNTASKADEGEASSTTTASSDDATVDRGDRVRANEAPRRYGERGGSKPSTSTPVRAKRPSANKP